MSWNPRRFAKALHGYPMTDPDPMILWLTADAVERIESGLDNGTIEISEEGVPHEGVWIGLQEPISTAHGEVDIIYVQSRLCVKLAVTDGMLAQGTPRPIVARIAARDMPSLYITTLAYMSTHIGHKEHSMIVFDTATWMTFPEEEIRRLSDKPTAYPILEGAEGERIVKLVRAAIELFRTPLEREVTATIIAPQRQTVGVKRKSRDYDVSVIDVRPPRVRYASHGESRHVEHDHRWTVRGHWRMQACGPGLSLRRRTWIDGYVAGPDDKPLKNRTKVHVINKESAA